jgi:endonuclease G
MSRIISAAAAFALGLAVVTSASAAPSNCPANFVSGQAPDLVNPKLATKTRELCFSQYAVLHSGLTRTPLYSADHLTARRVAAARRQRRNDAADTFHEEERLPIDERSLLKDFARSGYDRGHLSPNGDFDNPAAQGESFSLANIMPQDPDNNRNLWSDIESAVRRMASQHGEVWVVTVPIFAGAQTQWLHNRVAIPAKVAKAVYVPALGGAAVYLTDNAPGKAWQTVSVAQLRDMSGIDVFPALPETLKHTAIQLPEPNPMGRNAQHGNAPSPKAEASTDQTAGAAYHMLKQLLTR